MNFFLAMMAVLALVLAAWVGVGVFGAESLFGIFIPYAAILLFLVGIVYRVLRWAGAPVPFHIAGVCGQQKSLPWIKAAKVESPSDTTGVVLRMAAEVLFFRSLFRNERVELKRTAKMVAGGNKYLWLGGLAFHWSLLIIVFRHLRLLTEPVPAVVGFVQTVDGAFQVATPTLFITDAVVLLAVTYLVLRRVVSPQIRYISLFSDYLAVLLIAAVAVSGVLMRLFYRVDVVAVKELAMGMVIFSPAVPEGVGLPFYIHLFLASSLVAYFAYSKMVHGAGLLLSPTRNLKNNSRMRRHVNPWDQPVKVHTYEEYEDHFRDAMKKAGLPVEKE